MQKAYRLHSFTFPLLYLLYTGSKKIFANFISSRDGPIKMQKQGRDETCKKTIPFYEMMEEKEDKKSTLHLLYMHAADVG